jgi:malonyl CoA-acyl carrier protein transacylase
MIVIQCPGQGSQKVGMGKDLADAFPKAREVFHAVDEALGVSLSKIMWEGPEELLTRTDNAQPAILTHSAAVWAVVREKLSGQVAAGAGHSLGEYSAYVAAGALQATDAAKLVRRRGELMAEAGAARPGTMAAVMGLAADAIIAVCRQASTTEEIVVAANMNDPSQTVISGDPAAVARAGELLKTAGAKRVIPLKVSGAFHSPPGVSRRGQRHGRAGENGKGSESAAAGSAGEHRALDRVRREARRARSVFSGIRGDRAGHRADRPGEAYRARRDICQPGHGRRSRDFPSGP